MPKSKHHKKKYPNSEWVRRRNIRRMLASKQNSSKKPVAMEVSKDNTVKTPSPQPERMPKNLFNAIKNAFVGRRKNTKDVA